VELTCFKGTFRLKISTRHYVATTGRSRIWRVIVMTFNFWEGELKILINTELMDCKNTVDDDFCHRRFQWLPGLMLGPTGTRLLGIRFRISPKAWMSLCLSACLLSVSCVIRQRSLRRADPSTRGIYRVRM
jgi:hypothetical protein